MRLVGFAQASDNYLAGIERLTQRADFFAFRDGRTAAERDDIKRALDEAAPRALPATANAPTSRPVNVRRARCLCSTAPRHARHFPASGQGPGISEDISFSRS